MSNSLWEKPVDRLEGARLLGRVEPGERPLRLRWSASGVKLRIRCTALYVQLEAGYTDHAPWAAVLMDGALIARFPLERGLHWYAALLGMDANEAHDISIVRDTQPVSEDSQMRVALHALRSDGEVLPCPPPAMTVEFIGDSLTTGEGLAGPTGAMEWRMAFLSASATYAQTVCNLLRAEGRFIAMGGWGVYSAWDGNRDHRIPLVYDRLCAVEQDGGRPNDFAAQRADLIVVNLGTNDANVVRNAPAGQRPALRREIGRAAVMFLQQIRACQPDAHILWAYGLCEHSLSPTLRGAVDMARALGDTRVHYLSLPAMRAGEFGSREHPGAIAHRRAAEAIVRKWREIQAAEENKNI